MVESTTLLVAGQLFYSVLKEGGWIKKLKTKFGGRTQKCSKGKIPLYELGGNESSFVGCISKPEEYRGKYEFAIISNEFARPEIRGID